MTLLGAPTVIIVAFAYLALLFGIAWYGDRRASAGRSLIRSPVVYTVSLAVYCTSWTFYGAVGGRWHRLRPAKIPAPRRSRAHPD
jgi:Na+/proline symporter